MLFGFGEEGRCKAAERAASVVNDLPCRNEGFKKVSWAWPLPLHSERNSLFKCIMDVQCRYSIN